MVIDDERSVLLWRVIMVIDKCIYGIGKGQSAAVSNKRQNGAHRKCRGSKKKYETHARRRRRSRRIRRYERWKGTAGARAE